MYKLFDDVVSDAETGTKSAVRALQAWQYLIAKAENRQIVLYKDLSDIMGYTDSRPLGVILGCIMFYCQQNELPPLTLIVVNQTGVPGEGFSVEDLENYHQRREDVFNFKWYEVVPPTINDFLEARQNGLSIAERER